MKKQEIKRRKRIVPADVAGGSTQALSNASYSPQPHTASTPAFEPSASPDPRPTIESNEIYSVSAKIPVPVDFTNYNTISEKTPGGGLGSQTPSVTHIGLPSPRKRSLSATLDPDEQASASGSTSSVPHRLHAISSLLNPTSTAHDGRNNIDPALSNALPWASNAPPPAPLSTSSQEDKISKKERLRREAEAMRQELARKEKELLDLDDD